MIVPPEAVIAAISVKTSLNREDLVDSLENLLSITPLELTYRGWLDPISKAPLLRPITKIVVSYEGPANIDTTLAIVGDFFQQRFASDAKLAGEMIVAIRDFDPVRPAQEKIHRVERVIPKLIAAIETRESRVLQGWGPPEDMLGRNIYGPGLRRLPYMYAQANTLTSSLEIMVYYVLASVCMALGTPGLSLISAWGEFNPATGFRVGDASEVLEDHGVRLLDPDNLAQDSSHDNTPA